MDLIVTVPDDEVEFVKQVLSKMNFPVKASKPRSAEVAMPLALTAAQQQLAAELTHSLQQVELHQQGKIQLRSAYDLLDEV
ncbi:hypothetical protein A0257_06035 [Hymenobacter psoromatis]|nr:hypothetical protein A0257_06035 [Hymenobacter psoromatis]